MKPAKPKVVTGQQIGLLGGPLYTTYKVLGAIRLARELAGEAIYWLETNDADFNEINHIDYLDADGELRRLVWNIDSRGYSCGLIEIDESLKKILETFFARLRQTEFTADLKELALTCYRPGRLLGEASRLLARELFAGYPLTLFDPSEPEFRTFSRPILLREAGRTPEGQQCNLFVMRGRRREAIFKVGETYQLRDGTPIDIGDCELVPQVKTRSVCQDAYFQTHTYVAGPGEVSYLEEMAPQFRFHRVQPARVRPRMSATLIEPKVRRLLQKTGLTVDDILTTPRDELAGKLLKERGDFDYKGLLGRAGEFTRRYTGQLQDLGIDTKEMGKFLDKSVRSALGRRRAVEKERVEQSIRAALYLSDNLKPGGKPQERLFNIFYYMNLYGGRDFIHWLYDRYDFEADILEVTHG